MTKTELKRRCSEILQSATPGEPLPADDHAFVRGVLRHHDDWRDTITDIRVLPNRTHGGRSFHVLLEGNYVPFGFRHAVDMMARSPDASTSMEIEWTKAARHEIKPDMDAFRRRHVGTRCPITGEVMIYRDMDAHHAGVSFASLLEQWRQKAGVREITREMLDWSQGPVRFASACLRDSWRAYHSQHAELQAVTKAGHRLIHKLETMPH